MRGLYRFRSVLLELEEPTLKLVDAVAVGLSVLYYCYPENGNSISSTDAIFRIQTYRVLVLTLMGGGSLSVVVDKMTKLCNK